MVMLRRRRFLAGTALAFGFGAAGCLDDARTTEWSMFRASGDNRASTREHPGEALEVGWSLDVDDIFQTDNTAVGLSSPVGETETCYVVARYTLGDDPITAVASIEVADGTINWVRESVSFDPIEMDELVQPPFLWDDYVFAIGGQEGLVLERETGETAFSIQLPWRPTTVAGGDRALVALAGADEVAMVDLDEDEDVRWTLETPAGSAAPINPLTVLDDSIYVPEVGMLSQLRRSDGHQLWERPLDGSAVATPPLVDGHSMHLRLADDNGDENLVALVRSDRSENWRRQLGPSHPDSERPLLAYRAGRLYLLHDGQLQSIQVGDGEVDVEGTVDIAAPYPTVGGDSVYLLGDEELVIVDRHSASVTHRLSLPGPAGVGPQEALPREEALIVSRGDRLLGLQSP